MGTQKILYILRHAKAVPAVQGQEDRDRKLAERGIDQAKNLGEYLSRRGIVPQRVLCSAAVRTQETLNYISGESREPLQAELVEALYMASAAEMVALLSEVPESVTSVMIIGHNPGVHELCIKLVRDGEESLFNRLATSYPTCAMATAAFDCKWSEVGTQRGTLLDFLTPEML